MKYKSNIERTIKGLLAVFSLLAITMSILTGCVMSSDSVSGGTRLNSSRDALSSVLSETSVYDEAIPEEWRDHIYLQPRNKGFCKKLDGKILVYLVYVSDSESAWNEEQCKKTENDLLEELKKLETESLNFDANPEIFYVSANATVNIKASSENSDEWKLAAIETLGYTSVYNAQRSLTSSGEYDAAPIIFVLNKNGRAFASQHDSAENGAETLVVYSSDVSALRHELLHLFGAKDFYYPKEVESAAEKYLSDSIMSNSSEGRIDDLTAFLVGWTDELSKNAIAFLEETKHLSEDYLSSESDKNQLTGYGTQNYDDGVYTGNMVFGVPQGEGTFVWDNGDRYEGSWLDGKRSGKGKFFWANGDSYEGDFSEGDRSGKGKLTFANGDVYEGDFDKNERTGKGKYVWASGECYEGDFINSNRTGRGKYFWTNGDTYEGDFVDGERTGKGKYVWAHGDVYEGDFVNGIHSGQGKYFWTNGDVYEGGFKDNKFHGYGVWTSASGSVREGEWKNGEFVG